MTVVFMPKIPNKKQPTKEFKIHNERGEFTFKCRLTEADVETVVCRKLQDEGFRFFRQVTISQNSGKIRIREFRVDILVMDKKLHTPLAIIEVKKAGMKQPTGQLEKYSSTGLDVISCIGLEQVTTSIHKVISAQVNREVREDAKNRVKFKLKKKFGRVKTNQTVPDYIESLQEQLM